MLPKRLQLGSPVKVLSRGTTRPLTCLLEDEDGTSLDWVVKLPDKRRPMALVAEAVGSLLVTLAGVRTPEAGYLVLPAAPLNLSKAEEWLRMDEAIREFGGQPAFCSRFNKKAVEHTRGMESRQQPVTLLALFLVDAFMWHFDRTERTPNVLWDEAGLIAIDHGRALYEVEAIDESGISRHEPRELREENWQSHVAFRYLRRQFDQGRLVPSDVSGITERLQNGCLMGRFRKELDDWIEVLAGTHFRQDIAYFIARRLDVINSLNENATHVLASR
jgi:hypothetical protein